MNLKTNFFTIEFAFTVYVEDSKNWFMYNLLIIDKLPTICSYNRY